MDYRHPQPCLSTMNGDASDRAATHDELERVRLTIHELVAHASAAELRQPSAGTRWTNEQLLFHTVFGYMVVRALLPLVRMFGHLPDSASRVFARVLNATTPGFHVINYLGSCGGARVFHGSRLTARADRVIASLHRASLREDASRSTMQQGAHGATGLAPVAASDTQTVGGPGDLLSRGVELPIRQNRRTVVDRRVVRTLPDSQDGMDHRDGHRNILLVASPDARRARSRRCTSARRPCSTPSS